MTPGDRLRDERDAIQAKIDALNDRHAALLNGPDSDEVRQTLDAISDQLAGLEAELDEADAEINRVDPEPQVWGHDGL